MAKRLREKRAGEGATFYVALAPVSEVTRAPHRHVREANMLQDSGLLTSLTHFPMVDGTVLEPLTPRV